MLDWMRRDLASGPLVSSFEISSARGLRRKKRPPSVATPVKTSAAV